MERREFLQGAGATAAGGGLWAFLKGCGKVAEHEGAAGSKVIEGAGGKALVAGEAAAAWAASAKAAEVLSRSESVGQRLASIRFRVPPVIYSRLLLEWQRNNAEVLSCKQHLLFSNPQDRASIEQRLNAASEKNAEIERLMAQYG